MKKRVRATALGAILAAACLPAAGGACGEESAPRSPEVSGERLVVIPATATSPVRVTVAPLPTAATTGPAHLVEVTLGTPTGVQSPTQVVAHIDLVLFGAEGDVEKQVRLGSVNFFGADANASVSYVYDLTRLGLGTDVLAAVAAGRAAVEVALSTGAESLPDAAVPVLGAAMRATPPA